ncbi:M48 family metalloprotease [uncultured Sphingomonas sp.]|uniref:M48 family metalloprotease n=1 Tax=uncultured Sphingomonas sp. TaxID=158754 RepID=UPI0035CBCB78
MQRVRAVVLALLLAGCGGGGAPDGGSERKPVRVPEADRAMGAEQHPRLLAEFGGAYAGGQARYVAAVGQRVAAAAGLKGQCRFTLVNSDVVNAFAVPGCYIYITRGMLAIVGSEAELASVLGHELGHIVGAHSQRQQRRSVFRRVGVALVNLTGSERLTRLAGQAAQYFTLRYSRNQEYQSDDLGLRYLRTAGYDPYAEGEMLARLAANERFVAATAGRDEARSIPEWASSHPLTGNRIERATEGARAMGLTNDQLPENEAAYLRAVDGMLYGDDPEQGFVLGRRFAHPVMGITFEAPRGWTLTNSPRAVLLAGPGGARGEFGGGPMPAGGVTAYAEALATGLLGRASGDVAGVERGVINGLASVIVDMRIRAEGGVVPLTIAAYDGGNGEAYHFVLLSPPGRPSSAAGAALIGSFRRLLPAEAARLRPQMVRTVAVGPGDTTASLSARMADPNGRALFAMLNGLETGGAVRRGTRVKIVTDAQAR